MKLIINTKFTLIFLSIFLASCSSITPKPDISPISNAQLSPNFKYDTLIEVLPKNIDYSKWWLVFNDTTLNNLIEKIEFNQDLALAQAKYNEAISAKKQAQSVLLPTIDIQASANRAKSNNQTKNNFSLSSQSNWELDLWGRIRQNIASNEYNITSSQADLDAVRLSLQIQLAINYLNFRIIEKQLELLQNTVYEYQKSLKLTENRYNAGVIAKVDVLQAQTQLQQANTQLTQTILSQNKLENAIAILTNTAPNNFKLDKSSNPLPNLVKIGNIQTNILQNRPDIIANLNRIYQANEQIGIAKKAYLPNINLQAGVSSASSTLGNLFSLPNLAWSLGSALAVNLFDNGAKKAISQQAMAQYEQTVASYRQSILTALKDIEDNLAAQANLAIQLEQKNSSLQTAYKTKQITLNQYKAGTVSYLDVSNAQNQELSIQRDILSIQSQQYETAVNLLSYGK